MVGANTCIPPSRIQQHQISLGGCPYRQPLRFEQHGPIIVIVKIDLLVPLTVLQTAALRTGLPVVAIYPGTLHKLLWSSFAGPTVLRLLSLEVVRGVLIT